MKIFALTALAAGLTLSAAVSFAGANASYTVYIDGSAAYGAMQDTRSSANNIESIGCMIQGIQQPKKEATSFVSCYAVNAAGKTLSCATYNPTYVLAQAVMASNSTSYIYFKTDATGKCEIISVNNFSSNM